MTTRTRQPSAVRYTTSFLAGFLSLFIVGDRIIARLHLPYIPGSTNAVRKKWESLQAHYDTPDVVILGSSYEEFGVNPLIIDEWVTKQLGRPITSVNLAAPATSLATEYLVVRELLGTGTSPTLAYLGITPFAVDVRQRDWIVNGLRAFGDYRDLTVSWSVDGVTFYEALSAALFRSYHQWNDLRLMMEHTVLSVPWESMNAASVGGRGWHAWQGKTRSQSRRSTKGHRDNNPETNPFQWDNVNGQRAREMIRMLRDHGVEVRLLELPHASTALAKSDPGKNPRYRKFVNHLIAETGVSLVCPPDGLLDDQDFFDDGHLHTTGAAKLSRWLAHDISEVLSRSESATNKILAIRS